MARLAPVLLLALAACSRPTATTGFDGAVPSPLAQSALHDAYGHDFRDEAGRYGGGTLTVKGFAVVPNPVSSRGLGPVVLLERDGRRHYLPVETDGDVADLYRRVLGHRHDSLGGDLSAAYRAATR